MSPSAIRKARPDDAALVCKLLYELAEYEKLAANFALTEDMVRRDMLTPNTTCHCALGFAAGEPVGIATWFFTYRSFRARRNLYVEDLFVRPQFRGQGHGKALLAWLAREATAIGAGMEWQVLDWNLPAIAFYRGIGAAPLENWITYRLEDQAVAALAAT
nr:Acetyltransferase (GNAT) family [uncultured bacterium]